jgi:hypothetical protein
MARVGAPFAFVAAHSRSVPWHHRHLNCKAVSRKCQRGLFLSHYPADAPGDAWAVLSGAFLLLGPRPKRSYITHLKHRKSPTEFD